MTLSLKRKVSSLATCAMVIASLTFMLLSPVETRAGASDLLRVLIDGSPEERSVSLISDRIDLGTVMKAFDLRASMDVMGDRFDLVGEAGSIRLMLGSQLVLSEGLFSVLSSPVSMAGDSMTLPVDFLDKALPKLTGRGVSYDIESGTLVMAGKGTGGFSGIDPVDLPRYASFIKKDDIVPEELTRERPRGLAVVVIDPGHGGRSEGAKGSTGTVEKELVLSIAQKLKRLLEEDLGVKVVLTRGADYYVGLKERTAIANNNRADLFLSIHANATFRKEIDGFETYYLSLNSSDNEARRYAELENSALGVKGGAEESAFLDAILWNMAQMEYVNQSKGFANMVQRNLVNDLKWKDRGVRQAPFAVLMGARMPAALVEIGFISNPEQEIKLKRSAHQERLAKALFEAIADYNRGLIRGDIKRDEM